MGIVIGALAGGILALLMAPESGKKTRRMLSQKASDIKEKALDTAESARSTVMERAQMVGSRGKGFMETARKTPVTEIFEQDKGKMDVGSMMIGVLVGAALGAGTALLTAPQSGSKTRHMIEDKAVQIKDQAKSTIGSAKDKAQETISRGRRSAERTMENVERGMSDTEQQLKEEVDIMEDLHNREFPL